jgi:hypothetical protein
MEPQQMGGLAAQGQHTRQEPAFLGLQRHMQVAAAAVLMAVAQLVRQLKAVGTLEHQMAVLETQQP